MGGPFNRSRGWTVSMTKRQKHWNATTWYMPPRVQARSNIASRQELDRNLKKMNASYVLNYMMDMPTNSQNCFDSSSSPYSNKIRLTLSMSQLNGELTRQTVWSEIFASDVAVESATASRREEKLRRRRSRSGADATSSVPPPLFDACLPTNTSQARRSESTMAADRRASLMPSVGSKVWHRSPAHSENVMAQSPLLRGIDDERKWRDFNISTELPWPL